ARSHSGLGTIRNQPLGGEPVQKRRDVTLDSSLPSRAVASLQRRHHVGDRANAVAQLEDLRPRRIQRHQALRIEQHVPAAHVVVLEARLWVEARHARAPCRRHTIVPGRGPRSTESSRHHRTSHLNSSAATARACSCGARNRSVTRPSAYSASRGACVSRFLKYCSPAGSTHGYWLSIAASRSFTISGANISVSEAATASSHGLDPQKCTYASTAKRTPGRRKRCSIRSWRFTPIASPRRSHASMPPSSPGRPSWSTMRWIHC